MSNYKFGLGEWAMLFLIFSYQPNYWQATLVWAVIVTGFTVMVRMQKMEGYRHE